MVGLILALAGFLAQQFGPEEADLRRLAALTASPRPSDTVWRRQVFKILDKLEHGPVEPVHAGWRLLAGSGEDGDRANLILYQRRHRLPLLAVGDGEGPESTLERCLALWAARRFQECRTALESAVDRYPADARFRENLLWMDLRSPARLPLDASPRLTALAVIAARRTPHNAEPR